MTGEWWLGPISPSVRRRLRRRKLLRVIMPTLHPAEDRWRERAMGSHVCRVIRVPVAVEAPPCPAGPSCYALDLES